MAVSLQLGRNPPELAVCWYLGHMLATEQYLPAFLKRYLHQEIDVRDVEIIREKIYTGKRIDLCLYN